MSSKGPVLVSGASFAGLATAWWMSRLGYRVTLIEVAPALRRGGTPVDIEGEAFEILERMGLTGAIRAKALPPRVMQFKHADDSLIGELAAPPAEQGGRYELHRDDLLDILLAALGDEVEVLFGRSIVRIDNGPQSVSVTFADGSEGSYTMLLGCDGNRSTTRRLAFGAADCSHYLGGYFCIKVVPTPMLLPADVSQLFSTPGRTALLNGYADRTDIALTFRADEEVDYDHRDRAHQRRMIHDHFDGSGWKVPAMLAELDADDDFYFDKINQIRMASWSVGRVALVGDAGYCVSPLAGMGGSMAIIGAARLADALRAHGGDHVAAFRDYHEKLRGFVAEVQERAAGAGMEMMLPASDDALAERDRAIGAGAFAH